jgi:hypothetical protein
MGHITDVKNMIAGLIRCPRCHQWVEARYIIWDEGIAECCIYCD